MMTTGTGRHFLSIPGPSSVAERVRGREDDDGAARPAHAPLRHPGDGQRQLAAEDAQLSADCVAGLRAGPASDWR